jgi:hypothetical protein
MSRNGKAAEKLRGAFLEFPTNQDERITLSAER